MTDHKPPLLGFAIPKITLPRDSIASGVLPPSLEHRKLSDISSDRSELEDDFVGEMPAIRPRASEDENVAAVMVNRHLRQSIAPKQSIDYRPSEGKTGPGNSLFLNVLRAKKQEVSRLRYVCSMCCCVAIFQGRGVRISTISCFNP